jgi:BirA family transcriptional regulator, biotin operon repressor / biotin---[acetyl-CoA-carboxylase] ligase
MGHETVAGVVTGIGNKGELCMLVDGEERNYIGGELSLRLNHDT